MKEFYLCAIIFSAFFLLRFLCVLVDIPVFYELDHPSHWDCRMARTSK